MSIIIIILVYASMGDTFGEWVESMGVVGGRG